MKMCRTCQRFLIPTEFHKSLAAKDGLQSNCKSCMADWQKRNKANCIANNKRYREAHPGSNRLYYLKNKARLTELRRNNSIAEKQPKPLLQQQLIKGTNQ